MSRSTFVRANAIRVLKELRADAPRLLESEQHRMASLAAEEKELEQAIGELGTQLKKSLSRKLRSGNARANS